MWTQDPVTEVAEPEAGTFEYAWQRTKLVRGWLNECEARCLWEAVMKTPEDALLVEIGAHQGRSTTLLANSGRHVTTIDPIKGKAAEPLKATLAGLPNVRWMQLESTAVDIREIDFPAVIDLLFIDGDHIAPAPLNDFKHFRPNIKPGSFAVFHDYQSETDVTLAVDELERTGQIRRLDLVGSMYVGQVL